MSETPPCRSAGEVADGAPDAPGFEIPGTHGADRRIYRLNDYTDEGVTVVAFFPRESIEQADFLAWLRLTDSVDVLLVSDAQCSTFEHWSALDELTVPVLGDPDGTVAGEYGVDYEETAGGAVVLIDSAGRIRDSWHSDIDPMDVYVAVKRQLRNESRFADEGDST